MKRISVLALLLCSFALVAPMASQASPDAECPAYPYCAGNAQCNGDEVCRKKVGQTCGTCIAIA
jgi:hypothetical protein